MTEQKHTPEPWKLCEHPWAASDVHDKNNWLVASCHTNDDARRIVACVNACAGLDTEYLETVGLPEFAGKQLNAITLKLARTVGQRDQLRAALEACIDYGSMTGDDWVIEKARAALAATEGV